MKTIAVIFSICLGTLAAAPIGQGERDFALSSLHASRKLFLDSIAGLTPAQWNFKPAPDRWSIAEIAEHVVLTEEAMRGWEKEALAKPAVTPDPQARNRDQEFYRKASDRSEGNRAKAPQALVPSGRFKTPQAAADAFRAARDRTLDYVRTTQDDLRAHTAGSQDVYQLLLTTAGHTERHVAQIEDVKSAPSFPK